jgi:GT2 family glycosyltransferase
VNNTPLVSIQILNWNGEAFLEECLKSVLQTTYKPIEIILIDNASTDHSLQIASRFNIKVIANKENTGFAAGNNIGFRVASGKYIVTLNNDLTVEPSWLDEPVRILEQHSEAGIISCRQMSYYKRNTIDALYSYPTDYLLFNRMGHGKMYDPSDPLHTRPGVVIGAVGASAIWRKELLDQLGGFDERFFAFHEESDLCMRAFLAGWKSIYVPSAIVYHMGTESFKKRKKVFYYYRERNRTWFYYKFFPAGFIIPRLPVIIFRELKTLVVVAILNRYPGIYAKCKLDSLRSLRLFKGERKSNVNKFNQNLITFMDLLKNKKLSYEPERNAPC